MKYWLILFGLSSLMAPPRIAAAATRNPSTLPPAKASERRAGNPQPPTTGHWSFVPPHRPPVPKVKNPKWVRNPIDAFVLARLEREHIKPSPEADRATLIRRLNLDLLGLPPGPEEVQAFVNDKRPDAYEQLVDRLLASPHFGERWGRHWLDLARYADSEGYQIDRERPYAYVYRNWVIDAINRDLPFDQFTIEQLAGDLLPEATIEQKTAAGFHRNTLMNHEDGVDALEFRCKAKVDRVATTGTVWLGLTVACAECHSHKYDPIAQREFYQLYAFFNHAEEMDISAPQSKDKNALAQSFIESTNAVKTFVHIRGDFLRRGEEVQPGVLAVLHSLKPRGPQPDRLDLARWLVDPANPLTCRVTVNHLWKHLFGRGLVNTPEDFGVRGERPSHPELLDWLAVTFMSPTSSGLADASNSPLIRPSAFAKVSADKSGTLSPSEGERDGVRGPFKEVRGALTPQPALGWSRKAMIKLIVGSAAYRQSSNIRPDLIDRDPLNVLLSRQNRFRLESEIIRDVYLATGGLLNAEIGGPSFRPFTTEDFKKLGGAGAFSWVDTEGPAKYRRGLYVFAQRTVPYSVSITFDQANPSETCTRRERSNTPLQALTLLNNPVFAECARGLGRRIWLEKADSPREKLEHGFELCLARKPTRDELDRLEKLFADERELVSKNPAAIAKVIGDAPGDPKPSVEAASLVAVAQVLMNLDEFITRE